MKPRADFRGTALFCALPESQFLPALVAGQQLRRLAKDRDWSLCLTLGGAAYHGFAARRMGIPTVVWLGTTIRSERSSRPPAGVLSGLTSRVALPVLAKMEQRAIADAAAAYSQSTFTSAAARREYGIDLTVLRPPLVIRPDERPAPQRGRFNAIFIGRTSDPRKRFDVALGSVVKAAEALPAVEFVLSHTGEAIDSSMWLLPSNMTLRALGRPDDADLSRALAGSDVLLLTSSQEGFGLVVQEALAAGTPVVCTPCGGPEDMIEESGAGAVCKVPDLWRTIASLAEGLDERAELVRRALRWRSAQLDEGRFAERFVDCLEGALSGVGPVRR